MARVGASDLDFLEAEFDTAVHGPVGGRKEGPEDIFQPINLNQAQAALGQLSRQKSPSVVTSSPEDFGSEDQMTRKILRKSTQREKQTILNRIKHQHKENVLKDNQCESAKDYMRKVVYQVPLNKLYKIVASCLYEEGAQFCPVLVKIMDSEILKLSGGKQFLLQVWTDQGEMVFERALQQPPANWNISGNKLVYLTETNATIIHLVKLFVDEQPVLFEFTMPSEVTSGLVNSKYDHDTHNFIIPNEDNKEGRDDQEEASFRSDGRLISEPRNMRVSVIHKDVTHTSKQEDCEYMRNLGELKYSDINANEGFSEISVTECFKESQLITRAPDKMIDYFEDYVLLAYRDIIIYLNVSEANVESYNKSDKVISVSIDDSKIRRLDLSSSYKIVCVQPLGSSGAICSIVLEDKTTRQIRFVRVQPSHAKNRLKFIQLGILVNHSRMSVSQMVKYRNVGKICDKSGKRYQVSLVLRQNGRIEVYSDHILVNEYYNPQLQCVDIASDFNQFYFKFVLDSHKITPENADVSKLQFEIRKVPHFWRNRISFNTSRKMSGEKWGWTIHRRIANYFRLYTQILSFSMYMLVSHRNMISIYHMNKNEDPQTTIVGQENQSMLAQDVETERLSSTQHNLDSRGHWMQTIAFDQGDIRQMLIKKRPKHEREQKVQTELRRLQSTVDTSDSQANTNQKHLTVFQTYIIMGLIGTHCIQYSELSEDGMLTKLKEAQGVPGRIISYQDDPVQRTGVLLLTDDVADTDDYQEMGGCRLYTFPLKANEMSKVTLYSLKMDKFHALLTPQSKPCLSHDSQFRVMKANKEAFLKPRQLDEPDQNTAHYDNGCEVEKAYKDKDYCNVLICSSRTNNSTGMFPMIKDMELLENEAGKKSKIVKEIRLVKSSDKGRTIEAANAEDDSQLLDSFFCTSRDFGEDMDNYATVTEKAIKVYDKMMRLRLVFEGFNIRSCQQIHQSYLYTISDNVSIVPRITKFYGENSGEPEDLKNFTFMASGFYVYDLAQLFKGKVEMYKLASTTGGQCSLVSKSKFGNRFSFVQSSDNIVAIPFPHVNLIELIGMGQKNQYMVWREKNGFFTALDRRGNLLTWSLLTGQMLYQEKQLQDAAGDHIEPYEVYRADENDITYTQNFYNLKDSSLSLIKSKVAVSPKLLNEQSHLKHSLSFFEKILKKNVSRNSNGTVKIDQGTSKLDSKLFSPREEGFEVKVLNSQQRSDLFHFKVMELKVHDDTKSHSECQVRFHFFFELLRLKVRDKLEEFAWDINSNPKQHLYLSQDTMRLMEVVNNFAATVYYRGNIDENGTIIRQSTILNSNLSELKKDHGQQVKWKVEYRITRFPRFTAQTSVPCLFSPNFTYQFDVDFRSKNFTILKSETRHVYMKIPKDLLSTSWQYLEEKEAIQLICSRFKWESERIFRIVNQSNLDCLFEMLTTDPNDKDFSQRYLQLISVVKVDNLHENLQKLDSPHLLSDRKELEHRDVLERLIRVNQSYKTSLQHAINTEQSIGRGISSYHTESKDFQLLKQINRVNYRPQWSNQRSSFDIELSFTWLDWRIMDLVISEEIDFKIADIDEKQQLQLCFNILPYGRGMLHQLARKATAEEAYVGARDLFQVSSRQQNQGITGVEDGCTFEVPILPDIYGLTPLDICLGIKKGADPHKFIEQLPETEEETENLAMSGEIFRGIKDYGFLHSSHFIMDAIIIAVQEGIPSVRDYLKERLKNSEHSFAGYTTQNPISKSVEEECPAMGTYGALHTEIWGPESQIKEKMFNRNAPKQQPMNTEFLDLPYIFTQTPQGFEFIQAIAHSDDMKIYNLKSVQIIIEGHQAYWHYFNIFGMGMPMVIQLLLFIWWSNLVLPNLGTSDTFDGQNSVLQVCLTLTSGYLVSLEISSIKRTGWEYFRHTTRLLNLITPTLIMVNVYHTDHETLHETYFWTIQSWAAICIWLRFILFLGTLDTFSWLVRLIIRSFSDMSYFLIVFFLGVFCFADAFLSVELIMVLNGTKPRVIVAEDADLYDRYLAEYILAIKSSFLTAFGEFDGDIMEYRNADWVVFLLCVMFNVIVLLNLLIAIVSQTYAEMKEQEEEMGFKEKALQISFLQESLFGLSFFQKKPDANQLVFVAHVMTRDVEEEDVSQQVTQLSGKVDTLMDEFRELKEIIISQNTQMPAGGDSALSTKK